MKSGKKQITTKLNNNILRRLKPFSILFDTSKGKILKKENFDPSIDFVNFLIVKTIAKNKPINSINSMSQNTLNSIILKLQFFL